MSPLYRGGAVLSRTLDPEPVRPTLRIRPVAALAWVVVAALAVAMLCRCGTVDDALNAAMGPVPYIPHLTRVLPDGGVP